MRQYAAVSPCRFVSDVMGGYTVIRRADGVKLGRVQKGSEHYNLAPRSLTVHYWTATKPDGHSIASTPPYPRSIQYSTRAQAADALAALIPEATR